MFFLFFLYTISITIEVVVIPPRDSEKTDRQGGSDLYPCCVIIILVLLTVYGFRDKARVYWKHFLKKIHHEETTKEQLREELDEAKKFSYFERDKEGRYEDGRTKVIDLREDRN